jgi:hypothetical protein
MSLIQYEISSKSYLMRARRLLDVNTIESLHYAAFELRCGIEARLHEYLEAHDDVPNGCKREWNIGKLGKSIEKYLHKESRVVEVTFTPIDNPSGQFVLRYTPVTPELLKMGQQLGELLHARREVILDHVLELSQLRRTLENIFSALKIATSGDLIGPPRLSKSDRTTANLTTDASEGSIGSRIRGMMKPGVIGRMEVRHLDKL